ncbi:MAG: phosphonate ABC transporter, permease protein PhnE [Roseiarcus sp.]
MDRRHQHFNSRRRSRAVTHARASSTKESARILAESARSALASLVLTLGFAAAAIYVLNYSSVFDLARYRDAGPTIVSLLQDSIPPDFSRWRNWTQPLLDTLAMSASGTVLAALAALAIAPLAARTNAPAWLRIIVSVGLNALRSIPAVVWGIIFVAAVGFGRLPGTLALVCHSTGMLGKLYSETLEHVDPAPGNALRSQGVSHLGVLRFSILPQIMPRLVDVTLYRFEHNIHAATVMGLVGAGGLGLEITTAFHLFEYREAFALILTLLAMVTLINMLGAALRAHLLGLDDD